ncbi:RBP11-like subunits of RNA polymerase [Russula compacta]|nr:RBP11-like subunits of RNA polymerase [Russula compacta]
MTEPSPKIRIMPGAQSDLSAATPKVEFCGYSAPHPSENHIQIRIQMYDNLSSLTALLCALDDLDALFESIEDAYKASLEHDTIALWDEKR